MKILHLTTELPYHPGGTGGSTRQYFLLRGLARRGHDVQVIVPTTPSRRAESRAEEICAAAGIRLHVVERPESRLGEALGAARHDPRSVLAVLSRPWLAWRGSVFWSSVAGVVEREIREWSPVVVTVEHDHLAHWGAALTDVPVRVLMTQNASWLYHSSRSASSDGLVGKAWHRVEAARFQAYVRRHFRHFDALVATSPTDARAIANYYAGPVGVVSNGADIHAFSGAPAEADPIVLLFTGTLFYAPNAEGIQWFVRDVFPSVRTSLPGVQLRIVGRDPEPEVAALAQAADIEVIANVPDVVPYFQACTLAVVPLLSGGGTRLKIAEAFGARRAVISTTIGAEGLAVRSGEHLMIADTPVAFSNAIVELARDGERRADIADAGYRLAIERYDWTALGDELDRFIGGVRAGEMLDAPPQPTSAATHLEPTRAPPAQQGPNS